MLAKMPGGTCGDAPPTVWSGQFLSLGVRPASTVVLQIDRTTSPRKLRLTGEVDVSNAGTLSAALDPLVFTDGDITLDLEGVVFMDSTGIGILMRGARSRG